MADLASADTMIVTQVPRHHSPLYSPHKQEEEVIVWDEGPSSPFVSEVSEARQASSQWNHVTSDPEFDAIFEEEETAEVAPKAVIVDASAGRGKENQRPEMTIEASQTPLKGVPTSQVDYMPASAMQGAGMHATSYSRTPTGAKTCSPIRSSARNANQSLASTPFVLNRGKSYEGPVASAVRNVQRHNPDTTVDDTQIDDTCFSAFSAVPDMALFTSGGRNNANSGNSPTKDLSTPRASRKRSSPSRSPSPSARRQRSPAKGGETTSFLIDFTQQIEGFGATPSQQSRLSPSRTEPNLLAHLNSQRSPNKSRMSGITPAKQSSLMNLLDFELPPPPTPRSAPAFTIREVESLKSSFQSQISSIKAKLSGREAEVESLKRALEDAERRTGEAQEAARDDRLKREAAEQEKIDWERRGLDVENVLKSVKDEVLRSEEEKEALMRRADELETMNLDLQARLTSLPSISQTDLGETTNAVQGPSAEEVQHMVQSQLDQKIEDVSRELHAAYKKKYETKVAALKHSYEARSEKKCAGLQALVEELSARVEELQAAKDTTFSGELPGTANGVSGTDLNEARQAAERYRLEAEEQAARSEAMDSEMQSIREECSRLEFELEKERSEKGELVAAVDEMLLLQASDAPPAVIEDFKKSISRPSGLRAPGPSAPGRPSGLVRPGSKSKIMSNIERMGASRFSD